jgi:Holliday junction resolvase RusA-like endonuclease
MTQEIRFTVWGKPEPKGSARAFVPKGWTRPIVTSDNPALKTWESTIRAELQRVMGELDVETKAMIYASPIRVALAFHLPRPKSAPKRVLYPTKRPDLDKCVRAAIDALSGVAFHDDTQVVEIAAVKRYADGAAHVEIVIAPYEGALFIAAQPAACEAY